MGEGKRWISKNDQASMEQVLLVRAEWEVSIDFLPAVQRARVSFEETKTKTVEFCFLDIYVL